MREICQLVGPLLQVHMKGMYFPLLGNQDVAGGQGWVPNFNSLVAASLHCQK